MKKKGSVSNFLRFLFFTGGISLLFSGCVLFSPYIQSLQFLGVMSKSPTENAKNVKDANLRSPETATLFFGSTNNRNIINSCFFIQTNPDFPALVCTPGFSDTTFWFDPVPVKSALFLVDFAYQSNNIIYTGRFALNSDAGLRFFSSKPGLHYVGHRNYTQIFEGTGLFATIRYRYIQTDQGDEVRDLRRILKYYSGTDWEPVILRRLEELTNVN